MNRKYGDWIARYQDQVWSLARYLLRDAMEGEDEAVRQLVAQLQGIRIRQYTIHGDAERVNQRLRSMSEEMTHRQWQPVITVREPGESTYVLVKVRDEVITGVVVITSDGTEVVLVNAMGAISPEGIAAAAAAEAAYPDKIAMAL